MKMRTTGKRLLSMILVLVMVFGLIPRANAAETPAVFTVQVQGGEAAVVQNSDSGTATLGAWGSEISAEPGAKVVFRASAPEGKVLTGFSCTTASGDAPMGLDLALNNVTYKAIQMPSEAVTAVPVYSTLVDTVSLSVAVPAAGEKPDYQVVIPENAHYDAQSCQWLVREGDQWNPMGEEALFAAGGEYSVYIEVEGLEGYALDPGKNPTVLYNAGDIHDLGDRASFAMTPEGVLCVTVTYTVPGASQPPAESKTTITFRVENGTWDGKDSAEKTVEISMTDGRGTLFTDQIPTGMKPAEGYEGGAWDVTPNTYEGCIIGNAT